MMAMVELRRALGFLLSAECPYQGMGGKWSGLKDWTKPTRAAPTKPRTNVSEKTRKD